MFRPRLLVYLTLFGSLIQTTQANQKLSISTNSDNSVFILIDSTIHEDYGLSYPLTYEFNLPGTLPGLTAYKRYSRTHEWTELEERDTSMFFNGIEVVRFVPNSNTVFISTTFDHDSDSLFLKVSDQSGENIELAYQGMPVYYDNRAAAVVCSADDWADWFDGFFPYAVSVFRDHNLWLSVGIISEGCNTATWNHIQEQLDLGMVEAASHSRNHPHVPYDDADYEVSGSKADIIENLDLPPSFRKGDREYVYTWIAPYGEYDDEIDELVAEEQYLVSRMYTSDDYSFPAWVEDKSFYGSVGMSREVGPFWEGSVDIDDLNTSFDTAYDLNGIYHLMCHPHVLSQENIWNANYIWDHLDYVSNHKDIWYASVGQLYLYHLMQDENSFTTLGVSTSFNNHLEFDLFQNFPNPFNPTTTIRFMLNRPEFVTVTVYDIRGRLVKAITSRQYSHGSHKTIWDGTDMLGHQVGAGVYVCQVQAGALNQTIKMLFLE